MSSAKFVNIARLMTTYNFEIEQLPDNLTCRKCKLVLKDACLVSCGCTFCRICIDNMMSSGDEFCPGDSEGCGESSLSCFVSDFRANNIISRLIAKCPHNGCVHECQLANMGEHLQECQRKIEKCPFRELGCTRDNLAAEDMIGHLQQENRRHSEILVGMVVNINREIEMLKQRDGDSRRQIEMLKHDLVLKDGQIRTIIDQMIHLENENKSLAQGKEDLANRVRILQEKIDREIDERRDSDELDSARLVEHIDREIAAITVMIGSNKNELATDMSSVRDDIRSINQGVESISDDIDSMNKKIELMQELVGQVDARCELEIVEDLSKVSWTEAKTSAIFTGAVHPYKYQLSTFNYGGFYPYLKIFLRIHFGPNDEQLAWPFCGRVVITIADKDRREACKTISQQCKITRPMANSHSFSDPFKFYSTELISTKLDLSRGVHVSCVIVPGTGR